ncbi:MAG: porphobilinogen synthase [Candidatus Marinimicrobia bacterium]|nr:porphobilinogen synthase [Candidatus Neomarinimicrobiota bacterium]MCF7827775.1 porphobilinogen synthase [Candidatus Neomarinimicrobiota bacterium]MCF7879470.1 porphobilinogen synthase [Candidatus Neomarinimicrobiota bacterium]
MNFPITRMRRLRKNETIRRMFRETHISPDDFIYPIFVRPGEGIKNEIPSMPGQYQLSIDEAVKVSQETFDLGVPAIILFGIPEEKDEIGSEAYAKDGIVQRALREIKEAVPELYLITDVCMCEYTDHGHCGVIENQDVANDPTLELLAKEALSHAEAGADMVAPSDMMDGRIGYIREALDENGFDDIPVMAYSAKFASNYYGPFRDAAESPPQFGDRRSYQMDPPNADEALREVELDIREGADIVMVKPALPYLDIIRQVKDTFAMPTAAYNVSGEFAMIKAAAQNGWVDGDKVMLETLTSIKRAGADLILTYFAQEAARLLNG